MLYKTLKEKSKMTVKIPTEEGFSNFDDETLDIYHDAGYDAFVTGSAFAFMKELYGAGFIDKNLNKIRLYSNQFYIADFANIEEDEILSSAVNRAQTNPPVVRNRHYSQKI